MKTPVFFLEGPSEKEMLLGLLPRLLPPDVYVRYLIFNGKQDLEKNLIRRLRGWLSPDSVFIILRDQDACDCLEVKGKLKELSRQANKKNILIRIACHELETFYLGDLAAVEKGLGVKGLTKKQSNKKYRTPDQLGSPAQELTTLTDGTYQKLSGSRAIGPHLSLTENKSHSFKVLLSGIRKLFE